MNFSKRVNCKAWCFQLCIGAAHDPTHNGMVQLLLLVATLSSSAPLMALLPRQAYKRARTFPPRTQDRSMIKRERKKKEKRREPLHVVPVPWISSQQPQPLPPSATALSNPTSHLYSSPLSIVQPSQIPSTTSSLPIKKITNPLKPFLKSPILADLLKSLTYSNWPSACS